MSDLPIQSLAGAIHGDEHRLMVRVYYEDTDFSGLVYHANHLKYFERGRSDYLRLLGIHHRELASGETPLTFAVTQINIRYLSPARMDDILTVTSRLSGSRGAQVFIDQKIERDGILVAQGRVDVVCIDAKGAPKRLPKALVDVIRAQLPPAGNG